MLKVSANIGASTLPCLATSTNWLGAQAWVEMETSFKTLMVMGISCEISVVMEISFATSGGDF